MGFWERVGVAGESLPRGFGFGRIDVLEVGKDFLFVGFNSLRFLSLDGKPNVVCFDAANMKGVAENI